MSAHTKKKTAPEHQAQLLAERWASGWDDVDKINRRISTLKAATEKAAPEFVRFRHRSSRFGCAEGPCSYPYVEFNGRQCRRVNDDGSIRQGHGDYEWSAENVIRYTSPKVRGS